MLLNPSSNPTKHVLPQYIFYIFEQMQQANGACSLVTVNIL